MEKYQKKISEVIRSSFPGLDVVFTTPPDSSVGDIALPCFSFAKALKKSPAVIAEELKNKLTNLAFIEKTEASNGYLNFFIKKPVLSGPAWNLYRY